MRFGLLYELQLPKPWRIDDEYALFNNTLYQVGLADRLGFDTVWMAEHHFLEEYSHASAPEVLLGAASQRTSNIRLGLGAQLPANHPVRVAERAAVLDLVSNGRVDLCLAHGANVTELAPFGHRVPDAPAAFEESVRVLAASFRRDPVEFHGTHVELPPRAVLPKPRQTPHPPLWMACPDIDSIVQAGARGLGAVGVQMPSADAARAVVNAYHNAFGKHRRQLADHRPNPNLAFVSHFMCARTDEEAQRWAESASFVHFAVTYHRDHGPVPAGEVNLWREYEAWRHTDEGVAARPTGLIGSPDTIRAKLHKFAESGVDEVVLLSQTGRARHEHICESLERFATEVMDEFHAMEPQHTEWKRLVLAGEVQLPELDLAPHRHKTLSVC